MGNYAKAIIAALVAAMMVVRNAFTDGGMTADEWDAVISAVTIALGVWVVPNQPPVRVVPNPPIAAPTPEPPSGESESEWTIP